PERSELTPALSGHIAGTVAAPLSVGSRAGPGTSMTRTSGGAPGVGSGWAICTDPPLVVTVSSNWFRSRPPDGSPSTGGTDTSILMTPARVPVGVGVGTTGGLVVRVKTGRGGRGRDAAAMPWRTQPDQRPNQSACATCHD